jgi:hypothetical protein
MGSPLVGTMLFLIAKLAKFLRLTESKLVISCLYDHFWDATAAIEAASARQLQNCTGGRTGPARRRFQRSIAPSSAIGHQART